MCEHIWFPSEMKNLDVKNYANEMETLESKWNWQHISNDFYGINIQFSLI